MVKLTDFGLPEWHADPDKQANGELTSMTQGCSGH